MIHIFKHPIIKSFYLSILLCFFFFCQCRNDKEQQLTKFTEAISGKSSLMAFNTGLSFGYDIPDDLLVGQGYVFLVNASCSSCISCALDCYESYLLTEDRRPFFFMTRGEDNELFKYYYRQKYKTNPRLSIISSDLDMLDGLYTIKEGIITSYYYWSIK